MLLRVENRRKCTHTPGARASASEPLGLSQTAAELFPHPWIAREILQPEKRLPRVTIADLLQNPFADAMRIERIKQQICFRKRPS